MALNETAASKTAISEVFIALSWQQWEIYGLGHRCCVTRK